MSLPEATLTLTIDDTQAKAKSDQFVEEEKKKNTNIVTLARRTAQTVNALNALGLLGLDQVTTIAIEAGLRTIEFFTVQLTATALATPLGAFQAGSNLLSIGLMLDAITALRAGQTDIANARIAQSNALSMFSGW